jgi:hypothetical protein
VSWTATSRLPQSLTEASVSSPSHEALGHRPTQPRSQRGSRSRVCLIAIARLRSCGPRAALLLIVQGSSRPVAGPGVAVTREQNSLCSSPMRPGVAARHRVGGDLGHWRDWVDRLVDAAHGVRFPLRPLDGLRGLHPRSHAEEYDRTGSTGAAVVGGIGRTGRLVTCAALILFLTFASMASAPDTETKIAATGLAAGILLDATIIRALIVPAVILVMGRWNWWLPHWPARLLRVEPSLPPPPAAGEAG